MPTFLHPATRSWAALPTRFTSICWPRHPLGTEFSSTKLGETVGRSLRLALNYYYYYYYYYY